MYYRKQNKQFDYLVKENGGYIGFLEIYISDRDLGGIFSYNLDWKKHFLS